MKQMKTSPEKMHWAEEVIRWVLLLPAVVLLAMGGTVLGAAIPIGLQDLFGGTFIFSMIILMIVLTGFLEFFMVKELAPRYKNIMAVLAAGLGPFIMGYTMFIYMIVGIVGYWK